MPAFPEQQVALLLPLAAVQHCSSDVSAGDLGKGPVQRGCWGGKVPGVGRIGGSAGKQVAWSDIPGSSPHGTTCFHVLAPFVKDKNGIWSGDLACLILVKNKP